MRQEREKRQYKVCYLVGHHFINSSQTCWVTLDDSGVEHISVGSQSRGKVNEMNIHQLLSVLS